MIFRLNLHEDFEKIISIEWRTFPKIIDKIKRKKKRVRFK